MMLLRHPNGGFIRRVTGPGSSGALVSVSASTPPAGAPLLDADGNALLDADGNVVLSNGVDNSCCCGGEPPCEGCQYTPGPTITLDNIVPCGACFNNGGAVESYSVTGTEVSGTFTLPHDPVVVTTPAQCRFEYSGPFSAVAASAYNAYGCGGTLLETTDSINVTMVYFTGTQQWTLTASLYCSTGTLTLKVFAATFSAPDCPSGPACDHYCWEDTVSNQATCPDDPDGFAPSLDHICFGGTAAIVTT